MLVLQSRPLLLNQTRYCRWHIDMVFKLCALEYTKLRPCDGDGLLHYMFYILLDNYSILYVYFTRETDGACAGMAFGKIAQRQPTLKVRQR